MSILIEQRMESEFLAVGNLFINTYTYSLFSFLEYKVYKIYVFNVSAMIWPSSETSKTNVYTHTIDARNCKL